jgi:acyl dehydratase
MALPTKHLRNQGPVIAGLGATAFEVLRRRVTGKVPSGPLELPGPELHATVGPRPRDLIRDYVKFCGGDPSSYAHTIPPHMWPQWGFPLSAKTISEVPYPLLSVLNGGCRVEINAPLADDEPLEVSSRLLSIDENDRRAVLESELVTGTAASPRAIVATSYAIVPLRKPGMAGGSKPKSDGPAKQPDRVPLDAEELARWRLPQNAGLAFALLTGDFNPVHWIPPYAKAFGFRNTILHGFASMAKAWETLIRTRFAGSTTAIRSFDVKFTKPLTLPADVGLYLVAQDDHDSIWIGNAPGGPAYLVGTVIGDRPS